jgi:hypothetical protein
MAINRNVRTCPATGLPLHEAAGKLIRWNAVAGVVSLLVCGILALLVILTRWPAVHLLPADWLYLTLTAHGYEHMVAGTPTPAGAYPIICNESCGINHHTMASKLYVVKK